MGLIKTYAIVTRYVNYRDTDRILTLFSGELGKIQATARGCRKPKSRLLAASQLFCYGQYILYEKQGRYNVSQCEIADSFYDLRSQLDRFAYGTYLLNLCEEAVNPEEGNIKLFQLLLQALTYLSYSDVNPVDISIIFTMKFMTILGYRPRLEVCCRCGGKEADLAAFSPYHGGILCSSCNRKEEHSFVIHKGTLQTMRYILQMDSAKMGTLKIGEDTRKELQIILKPYLNHRLEKRFKSREFIDYMEKHGGKEGQ